MVLESFNLAVAVTIEPAGVRSAAHTFEVWRVDIVTDRPDKGESTGVTAFQRLSFFEDAACNINDISFHGSHLAYCLSYPPGTTVIVDWSSVNDWNGSDLTRWYLRSAATSVSCSLKLLVAGS
jgi:hypothetical protein